MYVQLQYECIQSTRGRISVNYLIKLTSDESMNKERKSESKVRVYGQLISKHSDNTTINLYDIPPGKGQAAECQRERESQAIVTEGSCVFACSLLSENKERDVNSTPAASRKASVGVRE